MANAYETFIRRKTQHKNACGFKPVWKPDFLYDFQDYLVDWACRQGRGAIFADCGMGKTPMQLAWAENVVRVTNKPVLIATPIAVGQQIVAEAERFGIDAKRVRDGKVPTNANIVVTNYEQLHKYDPHLFGGMVCDESSAIKDAKSERKKTVVEFMRTMQYRLLCTATAAPNDHWELGTSSEALGFLGFRDMITTFFKQEQAKDYLGWGRTKYRFRGHAEQPFWAWVCSWARSLRKPSDIGFADERFVLPGIIETDYVVEVKKARDGMLFALPARDMREERAERRHTLQERCDKAVELGTSHNEHCVFWCELNPEGDLLEKMMSDVIQVKGSMSDDEKEEALIAFSNGQVKRLIIKPKMGAWGLNWQHCHNTVVFPSHSYEQYYQLVRRFHRFGQQHTVNVARIICEGETNILRSLNRKQDQASKIFDSIVRHMKDSMELISNDFFPETERIPAWLS